jgi:two-component system OmpR family response regulator
MTGDVRDVVDLLESSGLFAASVEDGAAMSRAIDRGRLDLLLIDLRLRREDGLTLARSGA